MNLFMLMEAAAEEGGTNWMSILLLVGLVVVMYFLMIRPNNVKAKKEKEMRESLEVGDGITTIGGIVGRIVSIKEDTILIETGSDRTKIRFKKAAISEVEKLDDEPKK